MKVMNVLGFDDGKKMRGLAVAPIVKDVFGQYRGLVDQAHRNQEVKVTCNADVESGTARL